MRAKIIIISVLVGGLWSLSAAAQQDTAVFSLNETVKVEKRNTSPIKGSVNNSVTFTAKSLSTFPKFLGEADPVRFAQSLPGIQTAADGNSGLYVLGCDDFCNYISVAGVPTYTAPRLVGLFPLFNQNHFQKTVLMTSAEGPYLGGTMSFEPADTVARGFHADAAVGLISARGTFVVPLGQKVSMTASVRRSFLNTFYKSLLKFDDAALEYGFTDANFNMIWKADEKNSFDANFLYSGDKAFLDYLDNFSLKCDLMDILGTARWTHKGSVNSEHYVYFSRHSMDLGLNQDVSHVSMPSYINDLGLRSEFSFGSGWRAKASFSYYDILPQAPDYLDSSVEGADDNVQEKQYPLLGQLFLEKTFTLGDWILVPRLTLSDYWCDKNYLHLDPDLTVEFQMYSAGKLTLNAGSKHQYIIQTGMLGNSLPLRFWMGSGNYNDPMQSLFADLGYSKNFGNGAWSLSAKAYFKHLTNQLEYNGFILDIMNGGYNLAEQLIHTEGDNFGACLMLSKNAGKLTGWLSYSCGRALRSTDDPSFPDVFPASHERIHELNAVANYKIGRFDIGANAVLASGTPHTPASCLYLISDTVIADYTGFNSARLNPYFRLDISANYLFKTKGAFTHGINASLFNATSTRNELMYYLRVEDNTLWYKPAYSLLKMIPSISYFCKF